MQENGNGNMDNLMMLIKDTGKKKIPDEKFKEIYKKFKKMTEVEIMVKEQII